MIGQNFTERKIVLDQVSRNGRLLQSFNTKFKNDKEMVLAAVRRNAHLNMQVKN
jgi:hypothetical protein